jgi:rSAM/selenodomain-associated transferase 2
MSALPQLSVIVPALNEAQELPGLLDSLLQLPGNCEMLVVDGGSSDASERIVCASSRVRWLTAPRGRAAQMNAGARAARGESVLFLHADTRLPANAVARIVTALADPQVVAGSFRLRFEPNSMLLRLYALCSRLNFTITTFGDQGLFMRRSDFLQMGGYAPLPFLEDVEFQRRLRARGRFVKLPLGVTTSARRFRAHGVLRQQLRNVVLVALFLAGASPNSLKRYYDDRRAVNEPSI